MQPIDPEKEILVLEEMLTNEGDSVHELSIKYPVMLVFLRHFGCVFCKQALHEIAQRRSVIEQGGIKIVFVHMSDDETAVEYFNNFKLNAATYVCDPSQQYYRAFGLQRGSFNQLYGLQTWIRGFQLNQELGYGLEMAKRLGDSTQMPGVFVLQDGKVLDKFIHRSSSERPDYEELLKCCLV